MRIINSTIMTANKFSGSFFLIKLFKQTSTATKTLYLHYLIIPLEKQVGKEIYYA